MKKKVVLLDSNRAYLEKLSNSLNSKFANIVETHSFTNPNTALSMLREIGGDAIVAGEDFEIDEADIPLGCAYAVFSNSPSVATVGGRRSICRFRKAEIVMADIVALCSEPERTSFAAEGGLSGVRTGGLFSFYSVGGGAGGSTIAAAFALKLAAEGSSVLYMNLECYGSPEPYFEGVGEKCMTDVVCGIRGTGEGLGLKVESAIKKDESGVCFISPFANPQELSELTAEDIQTVVDVLRGELGFKYIVIDTDVVTGGFGMELMKMSSALVMVSEGSDVSAVKFERMMLSIETSFAREDLPCPATFLLYNKFNKRSGRNINTKDLPLLGGVPIYEDNSAGGIARAVARTEVFDMLM